MVTAGFCIVFMKVKVEWRSIIFCSIGAFFGLILGLEVIDDLLEKEIKKLSFFSIWFSFCVALFLLNRYANLVVHFTNQLLQKHLEHSRKGTFLFPQQKG